MPISQAIFTDDMRRDPYALYDQLRRASPLLRAPDADLWMVFDHDGVKRTLHDHDVFSSSVGASRGTSFEWLLFMDPPRHTQLRALISRAFTPRSIAGLEPRIAQLSRELLDRVIGRGEMDL